MMLFFLLDFPTSEWFSLDSVRTMTHEAPSVIGHNYPVGNKTQSETC